MGTDFLSTSDSGFSTGEHEIAILLSGDVESVRYRLVRGLEKLDYNVPEEHPLYAKREARGGGKNGVSANILDYAIKLHVGLKASGENSTLATFEYKINYPMMLGKAD